MKNDKIPLKNIMELFINLQVYENKPHGGIYREDIVTYSYEKRCQHTKDGKKWITFNQLDDSFIFDFLENLTNIDALGELEQNKYKNLRELVIKKHLDYELSGKGGD